METPEKGTEKNLSELKLRLSAMEGEKTVLQEGIKRTKRDIARIEGNLADSYEELFPGQELIFDTPIRLGITSFVRGYTAEEKEAGKVLSERTAYFCSGCGGWVKGRPNRLSVLLEDAIIEVRYSCQIDGHPFGGERFPIPVKEE